MRVQRYKKKEKAEKGVWKNIFQFVTFLLPPFGRQLYKRMAIRYLAAMIPQL